MSDGKGQEKNIIGPENGPKTSSSANLQGNSIKEAEVTQFSSAQLMQAIQSLGGRFDNLEIKIDSVDHKVSEQAKTLSHIKKTVEEVEGKVFTLENDRDKMLEELNTIKSAGNDLRSEFESLKASLKKIEKKTDENNQYSRRENIRIYGIKEEYSTGLDGRVRSAENESDCIRKVLDIFRTKMDLDVDEADLTAVHRLGQIDPNKTESSGRGMIVRFLSRRVRDSVMSERKKIFKTGIVITEDLSPRQYELLSQVKKDKEVCSSAWTRNGTVFMKTHSEHIIKVLEIGDIMDSLKRRYWAIKWDDFNDEGENADRQGTRSHKRLASTLTPEGESTSPLAVIVNQKSGQSERQSMGGEGPRYTTPKKIGLFNSYKARGGRGGRGRGAIGYGMPRYQGWKKWNEGNNHKSGEQGKEGHSDL